MQAQPALEYLIVIGASAGGIEALSYLVATLPTPFPAPIVIAQHLDPSYTSHLQPILERASSIPVRTVSTDTPLENGVIYVVPANHNVEITDHEVRVHEEGAGRPKPSVDLLFRSAADAFGEELIAVILTGTGSDGADGARAVKEQGGTVIIQNPQTASHPGMPLSLAPSIVDIAADLPAIGPLLHAIVTGAYTPPPPEQDRQMRTLLEQLRQQSGIDFSRYRETTIQRRLQRRIADTGMTGIEPYLRYLKQHPEEYERLVSTFLIKVTDFFRDAELFDHLRDAVLPELIARARGHGNELRFWSAGCATGEEAYSLAILVAEALGEELANFRIRIFATDVDATAVAFARHGVYPASSLQEVPPQLVERYFTRLDGAYEIQKAVRALLVFGQHDLAQRAPFPRTDLVLCRNVLIYFTPELQHRALQLFAFSLRPGGRLVLGKSETTNPLPEYFALEQPHLRVYRRQGERILIPADTGTEVLAAPPQTSQDHGVRLGRQRFLSRDQDSSATRPQRPAPNQADLALLHLRTGVVILGERYTIRSINGAARRLLQIHGPGVDDDLVHLSRTLPSEQLRSLIDAARRGEAVHEVIMVHPGAAADEAMALELSCQRLPGDGAAAMPAAVLVEVVDVSERARLQAEATRVAALARESQQRLAQLLAANEELGQANSLLRTQNEELLLSAEEARAASEEVEALSEEQQAANEELETLNEEQQATVEELRATNEDLQARSEEVQDLATASEAGRARLSALLSSMADAALTVDHDGQIVLTNAAFERLFGPHGVGLQPEDEEGRPLVATQTLWQRAARGEPFVLQFATRDAAGSRHWFEAVGQPVVPSTTDAGIVIIRDITDRNLRRVQAQFVAAAAHELRTPLTALQGSLQMLSRSAAAVLAEQQRQYLDIALHEAQQLRALAEELLDVERIELGQLHVTRARLDLAEVVQQAVTVVQPLAEGREVVLAPVEGPVLVDGDRGRLEQVVVNLLTNAIRYAPESRRIDVRLSRVESQAQLEVQDYGPGIGTEDQVHLFDRFYQAVDAARASNGGLGLGLFISRQIVVAHEGTIAVHAEPGQGSTFTVRLPLAAS